MSCQWPQRTSVCVTGFLTLLLLPVSLQKWEIHLNYSSHIKPTILVNIRIHEIIRTDYCSQHQVGPYDQLYTSGDCSPYNHHLNTNALKDLCSKMQRILGGPLTKCSIRKVQLRRLSAVIPCYSLSNCSWQQHQLLRIHCIIFFFNGSVRQNIA